MLFRHFLATFNSLLHLPPKPDGEETVVDDEAFFGDAVKQLLFFQRLDGSLHTTGRGQVVLLQELVRIGSRNHTLVGNGLGHHGLIWGEIVDDELECRLLLQNSKVDRSFDERCIDERFRLLIKGVQYLLHIPRLSIHYVVEIIEVNIEELCLRISCSRSQKYAGPLYPEVMNGLILLTVAMSCLL